MRDNTLSSQPLNLPVLILAMVSIACIGGAVYLYQPVNALSAIVLTALYSLPLVVLAFTGLWSLWRAPAGSRDTQYAGQGSGPKNIAKHRGRVVTGLCVFPLSMSIVLMANGLLDMSPLKTDMVTITGRRMIHIRNAMNYYALYENPRPDEFHFRYDAQGRIRLRDVDQYNAVRSGVDTVTLETNAGFLGMAWIVSAKAFIPEL